MADKLTAQQRLAVENRGGNLLVSAAAGSGKTKVLVDRLMSYISDPVSPANLDDFLIITYTKAAASELRGKIGAKLSEKLAEEPWNRNLQKQMQRLYLTKISTIHSFCADILREYAYKLDIAPDFRVADETECAEIQQYVLNQLLESAYSEPSEEFRAFVDSQGFGRNDSQILEIILKVFNSSRCHLNPQKWLSWCLSELENKTYQDISETLWGNYLICDLAKYLDQQIEAFSQCIVLAESAEYMDKPVALFCETRSQLENLRNCKQWDEIVDRKQVDYGRLTFSKKCTDLELAEQMKAVRNACKKGLEKKLAVFSDKSDVVLLDLDKTYKAAKGLVDLVQRFSSMYEDRKNLRRVLDFSDLEQKTLDLVLGKQRMAPTLIAREIGMRFREVMIDEYQDTNEVQDSIFAALTSDKHNCFMVGDVKQSIYQFRLADPDIFIQKYNSYDYAENVQNDEGRKVLLSNNFRSSAGVISAVNDVFSECMSSEVGGITYGLDEMLKEGIPHCSIMEPEVEVYGIAVAEDTYYEESSFVAGRIEELLDGTHMVRNGGELRPIVPDDIVILLRSPGSVGAEFKHALEARGIPSTTGSGVDLLETEEVSVLVSLLQIISNPIQDIPLIAVLSSRVFGFTANDLSSIRANARKISFYDAVLQSDLEKCKNFISQLDSLRRDARFLKLPQLIQRIFVTTRMDSIYSAMSNGVERLNNLQEFYQLAVDFSTVAGRNVDSFLNHLDSVAVKGLVKNDEKTPDGLVRIMSIHKSKGLEFPVVFLCGLSRRFNQEALKAPVVCDKSLGLGLSCVDVKKRIRYPSVAKRAIIAKMIMDGISEELRVLYVAMTRPRDRLIMTYAVKNLHSDLADIALRDKFTPRELFAKEVDCLGSWVLQSAMRRTEAGAFFAISAHPGTATVSEIPWKISVVEQTEKQETVPTKPIESCKMSDERISRLSNSLSFCYSFNGATKTPSKLTVTQLKGRIKDMEISNRADAAVRIETPRMKPRFGNSSYHGKDFGNAIHSVMQHIDLKSCSDADAVSKELDRMVSVNLISAEQREWIDPGKIHAFFSTEIGKQLCNTDDVLREFKFSLLDDGIKYSNRVGADDRVLLQGVIDCAIVAEEGITVIDFKTDFVSAEDILVLQNRYAQQVRSYGNALSRIYKKPIKQLLIYSFCLNKFIEVDM